MTSMMMVAMSALLASFDDADDAAAVDDAMVVFPFDGVCDDVMS